MALALLPAVPCKMFEVSSEVTNLMTDLGNSRQCPVVQCTDRFDRFELATRRSQEPLASES